MNEIRVKLRKRTQWGYLALHQWVRGILGLKFGKYGWTTTLLLRIQVRVMDRGWETEGIMLYQQSHDVL
jgi:hypothetical protein